MSMPPAAPAAPPFCALAEPPDDEAADKTDDVDEEEDRWWWPISIGVGLRSRGLGGGLGMIDEIFVLVNGKLADSGNEAPPSGKKLTIELVGLIDSEPVGLARSEPVDMLIAGLSVRLPIVGMATAFASSAAELCRLVERLTRLCACCWAADDGTAGGGGGLLRTSSALCTKWQRGP